MRYSVFLLALCAVLALVAADADVQDVHLTTGLRRSLNAAEDVCFGCSTLAAVLRQDVSRFLGINLDNVDIPQYERLADDGYDATVRLYREEGASADELAELLIRAVETSGNDPVLGEQLSKAVAASTTSLSSDSSSGSALIASVAGIAAALLLLV